jgi:hypothetical protein
MAFGVWEIVQESRSHCGGMIVDQMTSPGAGSMPTTPSDSGNQLL